MKKNTEKKPTSSLARAGELCRYATTLARHADIPESDREKIKDECWTITKRLEDPNLYLGVVGEFTTGKSTFINALLGMELLREDILPGTTCAPTLLSPGPEFRVIVEFSNGRHPVGHPHGPVNPNSKWVIGDDREHALECIRKASTFLHKYTADEEYAKEVSLVRINIPFDNWHLPENVVIVDTPGLNSDNPRHGEVTRKAVQNICDLCCVLTSASIPCPSSLTQFLSENLRQDSGRCVGVVTQIDRLRPREREGMIRYVAERMESEGLPFREVVGVASIAVVHPDESGNEGEAFRSDFAAFTKRLSQLLQEGRDAAISGKVGQLARHLADKTLMPVLLKMKQELNARKSKLQANQLANPEDFIQRAEEAAEKEVSKTIRQAILDGKLNLDGKIDDVRESIENSINRAVLVSDVETALKGRSLSGRIHQPMKACLGQCGEAGSRVATAFLSGFRDEFNKAYRDLAGHSARTPVVNLPDISVSVPDVDLSDAIGAISLLDDEDDKQRMGNAAKGAAAGAAVGSLFFGIGAMPGALIGAALGGIFGGKDISEFKAKARNKLGEAVTKLRKASRQAFEHQALAVEQSILGSVKKQLGQYRSHVPTIRGIIVAERSEQTRILSSISATENDIAMLQSYL